MSDFKRTKPVTELVHGLFAHQAIVERDDGQFQIGLADDAPGPFESRTFAMSIADLFAAQPFRRRAFLNIKTAKEARLVARLSARP